MQQKFYTWPHKYICESDQILKETWHILWENSKLLFFVYGFFLFNFFFVFYFYALPWVLFYLTKSDITTTTHIQKLFKSLVWKIQSTKKKKLKVIYFNFILIVPSAMHREVYFFYLQMRTIKWKGGNYILW